MSGGFGGWVSTGGVGGDLDDLTDVDLTSTAPADGDSLVYNSGSGLWVPQAVGSGGSSYGARVERTTSQSVPNATTTTISFDTEHADDGGLADLATNATRLTIPTAGWYVVTGYLAWTNNGTGGRQASLRKNGSDIAVQFLAPVSASYFIHMNVSMVVNCATGDYLELAAWQDSGAARNVLAGAWMSAVKAP